MGTHGFSSGTLLLASTLFLSATWYVQEDGNGDAPTISAAMDSAAAGDTVLVGPGDFEGPHLLKADVHLVSDQGPDATRLSGECGTLYSHHETMARTLIEGFSFVGITGSYGCAAATIRSNYEVAECDFDGVIRAGSQGLLANGTSIIVRDCNFTTLGLGYVVFGGVATTSSSSVAVERCAFEVKGSDAGVFVQAGAEAVIRDCEFAQASGHRSSGVQSAGAVDLLVERCSFDRLGEQARAGIFAGATGTAEIRGNTIVNGGRGVYAGPGVVLVLENNVFAGNETGAEIGGVPASVSCNLVWGNGTDWDGILDPTGVDGNVRADPLFCDVLAGDFTVSEGSPCLPQNSNGCGLIGALGQGCGPISVDAMSWGGLKALYR